MAPYRHDAAVGPHRRDESHPTAPATNDLGRVTCPVPLVHFRRHCLVHFGRLRLVHFRRRCLVYFQPSLDRPYVADLGFRGRDWQGYWATAYGATVLTKADLPPDATDAQQHALRHTACSLRQMVETAFGWLTTRFGLEFPRARTMPGLLARLGAKVAAFNCSVYFNMLLGRPPFAACSPYDLV